MRTAQTQPIDFAALESAAAANPPKAIDTTKPVWIFGAGGFGRSLCAALQAKGFEVAGFVDNSTHGVTALGLPVLDWRTLCSKAPGAQVALGMLNHYVGFQDLVTDVPAEFLGTLLMPWDTYEVLSEELGWRYWLGRRDSLLPYLDRLEGVASRLADDVSRNLLVRIAAFRLGMDTPYSSYLSPERRYFNELTLKPGEITYVDCGAYTGDTYADLLAEPDVDCKRAYLLEPDPENFRALVRNVSSTTPEAICLPLAAAEDYSILSFSSGNGEGSTISTGGDDHIAAVGLDQLLPHADVNMIKIDVEGAEALVLRGAQQMIGRCRPTLLVSLYHNPEDLWGLPELLFKLCDDYAYYIRQHQYNTFDSVLYAIPLGR
jgi:FkbM family methyltransferase